MNMELLILTSQFFYLETSDGSCIASMGFWGWLLTLVIGGTILYGLYLYFIETMEENHKKKVQIQIDEFEKNIVLDENILTIEGSCIMGSHLKLYFNKNKHNVIVVDFTEKTYYDKTIENFDIDQYVINSASCCALDERQRLLLIANAGGMLRGADVVPMPAVTDESEQLIKMENVNFYPFIFDMPTHQLLVVQISSFKAYPIDTMPSEISQYGNDKAFIFFDQLNKLFFAEKTELTDFNYSDINISLDTHDRYSAVSTTHTYTHHEENKAVNAFTELAFNYKEYKKVTTHKKITDNIYVNSDLLIEVKMGDTIIKKGAIFNFYESSRSEGNSNHFSEFNHKKIQNILESELGNIKSLFIRCYKMNNVTVGRLPFNKDEIYSLINRI